MTGWGRVSFLLAVGIFLGAGCGGRTSALDEEGYGPDGSGAHGSGADGQGGSGPRPRGGNSSTGGTPAPAGGPSYGGAIGVGGVGPIAGYYPGGASYGGYPIGGYGYGGAYPYPYGGAYPYPYGGAYPTAGSFPIGGSGFGGNPNQPGGACCEARMEPSCRPRAVANCVCRFAPNCCDKMWDAGCASLIEPLGCGYCEEDCESCLNRSCSGELARCYEDFGCLSIYSCMDATGCGAFQCYTEGQCRGVIDQWGGPGGYSMSVLLDAYRCAIQSGCPCN